MDYKVGLLQSLNTENLKNKKQIIHMKQILTDIKEENNNNTVIA